MFSALACFGRSYLTMAMASLSTVTAIFLSCGGDGIVEANLNGRVAASGLERPMPGITVDSPAKDWRRTRANENMRY